MTKNDFEKKIYKNTDSADANWFFKPMHKGHRRAFDLGTDKKNAAAKKAKDIYHTLHGPGGWKEALAKYCGEGYYGPPVTVGEYIERVGKIFSGTPMTFSDYSANLRRIVGDIAKIPRSDARYDMRRGGREKWLARVNAVSLDVLSRESITAWQTNYVAQAKGDHLKVRSAKTSANSIVRQSASLMSPARLELLGFPPGSSPFVKIKLYPSADCRFVSSIDPIKLFEAGLAELETEELKAFVLLLACGLRRNEADKIEWSAVLWEESQLYVGHTKYLKPKSEKSVGGVDIEPQILSLFRGWRAQARGEFILESHKEARMGLGYAHYRCQPTFNRLSSWLAGKGVTSRTPLHTLRKLFGSRVCELHGLWAASTALRHADVAITSKHYLSKKRGATPGFGIAIGAAEKVVGFDKGHDAEKERIKNLHG